MSSETARTLLAGRAGREVASLVVERAIAGGRLREIAPGVIALPAFAERAKPAAQQAASAISEALDAVGLTGASEAEIVTRTGERPEAVRTALTRLANAGSARRLGGLWFAEQKLEVLRGRVRDWFSEHPTLSVPAFKELAGVSRKQAIPLLEQLDREGTTRRKGDDRILGATRPK